ncbi:hypothetical protein H0H81_003548 [Sphagnurus paluster]|uniref:Uncharacterized protein n=1 Tax=Sphagnurus paluster TaxID=117069 RepID=A0A9P7KI88_9AGAR|nr:hypothetical protein H0H81_003548 [Sphagnurus paluster]
MSIVWIIIESGAIYTAAAIVQLVLFLEHLNAGTILEMILVQLSAIAPALIVIRIGMGVAYNGENETYQEDVVLTTMHDIMPSSVISTGPSDGGDRQENTTEDIVKKQRYSDFTMPQWRLA